MADSPEDTLSPAQQKRTLGIIFLTLFLDLVGFSIIFPLFPAMLDYYLPQGANNGSLLGKLLQPLFTLAENSGADDPRFMTTVLFGGILGSLYSLLQFVFAPIWGAYSDRVGRRKVLLLTIAGLAVSYTAWSLAASFWILILSRILGGIMGGNLSVATAAVADATSRKKRSSGLAIIGIAFGLGFIVGPGIGGLLAKINLLEWYPSLENFGVNPFSAPALLSLLLSLINLAWVSSSFKETLPPEKRSKHKPENRIIALLSALRSPSSQIARTNQIYLVYMFAFSGMEFTLSFLAVERFSFSPTELGSMFILAGIVIIVVQGFLVRKLADPVGERNLATTGMLCGIIAFLLFAFTTNLKFLILAVITMAFSSGLTNPTLSALVSLYSKDDEQGATLGIFRSAGSLARAIGPLLAAFTFFAFGSQIAYLCGAAIIVLPLILALRLPKPVK